jgi:hypothetical protein
VLRPSHAEAPSQAPNTRLINIVFRRTIPEIKLKRTDTGEEKKKED